MKKNVLVINENETERILLTGQLENEYQILGIPNNKEGLHIVKKDYELLSAVIIDMGTRSEDGFDLLTKIRTNSAYMDLPVILMTGDMSMEIKEKAIDYKANAILTKPYEPELLKKTLRNVITVRENTVLANRLSKDRLTGMMNHDLFFDECDRLIKNHEPGYYVMACVDIDNFKVINDQYGMKTGDNVLKHVAACITECCENLGGIACRFTGDRFAILYPAENAGLASIRNSHILAESPKCINHSIKISTGRYYVNDCSISANIMFERATLAEESIKGRYDVRIAEYNDSMREKILNEQHIVNIMNSALEAGEFVPFLQPQYNHSTGAIIGCEALARWKRDGKYQSAGDFIPIFERNGFIYEVDKYIWEQICIILRRWMEEKRQIIPISVNISFFDLYKPDFFETLSSLVQKYRIPVDYLRLEIMESTFIDLNDQIKKTVNRLIDYGFTVEIDDFGSGYSSLNTLKDVAAQILKLDMKAFLDNRNSVRSGNIIESVVRMAKWLGMAVIAEGVEKMEHADYLQSIGCYYIQGYCYAKPMPVSDYEKLLESGALEPKLTRLRKISTLDNNEFWNPDSMETLIFNSYVGGACILEYFNGNLELLRVNIQYLRELGNIISDDVNLMDLNPTAFLDEANSKILEETVERAITSKKEASCELMAEDIDMITEYINFTLRVIASTTERVLLYCVITNVTERRMTEQKLINAKHKEMESAEELRAVINNIDGGVTATIIRNEEIDFLIVNDKYFEILGYTREQYETECKDKFEQIHQDDRERVKKIVSDAFKTSEKCRLKYRIIRRDGGIRWIQCNISMVRIFGIQEPVQLAVYTDESGIVNSERKNHEDVMHWISSRRSTRNFSVKPVEEDKLYKIVEAGRYAPSGGNSQSCHFTVIIIEEVLHELASLVQDEFSHMDYDKKTYSSLVNSIKRSKKGNYVFHYNAPVLIVVSNKKNYGNAMADSACALENMMLMSNAEDLGSCWINQLHWLDDNKLIRNYLEKLGLPKNETICGALAVGYADTPEGLPLREPLERKGNIVTWVK